MSSVTNIFIALTGASISLFAIKKYQALSRQKNIQKKYEQQITIHQILQTSMKIITRHSDAYKRLQPNKSDGHFNLKSLSLQSQNEIGNQQAKFQEIMEPYRYILGTGGKKIRITMAIVIAQMFLKGDIKDPSSQSIYQAQFYKNSTQDKLKKIIEIGTLIELLHVASLIIDDIEDQSLKRRDQPCAHLVYGVDRSINAANLMYFLPFKKLLQYGKCEIHTFSSQTKEAQKKLKQIPYDNEQKVRLINIFMEQMLICHIGQGQDLLMHKLPSRITQESLKNQVIPQLPTAQQYFRMISAKTGALLRMMVKMIATVLKLSSQNVQVLQNLMTDIGISFQITDDILNLTNPMGKGTLAQDLYQKKFTLVIDQMKENLSFMMIFLKQRNQKTEEDIKEMLKMINQTDAIQKSKAIAKIYAERAIQSIQKIKCQNSKRAFVELVKFIVQRDR